MTDWIEVSKELPPIGMTVLVSDGDIITCAIRSDRSYRQNEDEKWDWDAIGIWGYEWEWDNEPACKWFTHWQYCPELPKKAVG
jgi:hypothetical protein